MKQIFILHGWSQDKDNQKKWQPFINLLKKENIKTIFLKIPGLDYRIKKPWQLHNYIDWLDKKLPKNRKVTLLGHSFGGQISALYSSQHPDKIKSLILLDSAGIKDKSLKNITKKALFYLLAKTGKIILKHPRYKKLLYKFAKAHDYEKADNNLKQTLVNVINHDISSNLKNIFCRTLIIWGQNDKITPISNANLFNQTIKYSKLYFIKDARHSPQFTHSEAVVKIISDFLNAN